MSIFSSLSRQQKEAIGLLQIGTFLEYFDLMLYVHMAVLLNELFFPKTDPHTAALLSAFAFCSTYALRPLGALIFGYIGDHIGRKVTVIITTTMMAVSCIFMANMPTYAQAGMTAAWGVTICRIVQGFSAMGEVIGAEIYLTEMIKSPVKYVAVSLMNFIVQFGTLSALAVAFFVTSFGMNWRVAFWIGACLAVIGSVARNKLRESPDFLAKKNERKNTVKKKEEKVNKKSLLACFLMDAAWPVWFYFTYIYCSNFLKSNFHYTPEQVIQHNFIVAIFQALGFLFLVFLSSRFHPFQIIKAKRYILYPIIFLCPFVLNNVSTPLQLLIFQVIFISFPITPTPSYPIMFSGFPILKRFRCSIMMFALAHGVMHIVNTFSLVYLINIFGNFGVWVTMISVTIGFYWGVNHFEKLEKKSQTRKPLLRSYS